MKISHVDRSNNNCNIEEISKLNFSSYFFLMIGVYHEAEENELPRTEKSKLIES